MVDYKHLLVAVDLTEESKKIADRASALARQCEAKLSIVYIIEPVNFAYGGDIPMDLTSVQNQLENHASNNLTEFAKLYKIPKKNQHIVVGLPQTEIHRLAKEKNIDLIVVGSHGRHGLALIFGSTANGVLHGATCDVLAVRVGA